MYEKKHEALISKRAYLRRLLQHTSAAVALFAASLAVGVGGYHLFEDLSWTDSLLNASMILGGMGPVNDLRTEAGKIFASIYALYSGLIILVVAGVILTPMLHRFLHRFHIDSEE